MRVFKKSLPEKWIKYFVYPRLRYTQKILFLYAKKNIKCFFWVQSSFSDWKKKQQHFLGTTSILLRKFLMTHIWKLYDKHFLTEMFSFLLLTIHRVLCQNKKNSLKIRCLQFSKMYEICMIRIFGLWRSTRMNTFVQIL